MHAAEANPEFTMKLRDLENWDRHREDDLTYNRVRRALFSSHLREFRERLRRKRYIYSDIKDVRAAIACCRLPDLRCSRYLR
jgi:hypothetical protein